VHVWVESFSRGSTGDACLRGKRAKGVLLAVGRPGPGSWNGGRDIPDMAGGIPKGTGYWLGLGTGAVPYRLPHPLGKKMRINIEHCPPRVCKILAQFSLTPLSEREKCGPWQMPQFFIYPLSLNQISCNLQRVRLLCSAQNPRESKKNGPWLLRGGGGNETVPQTIKYRT